MPTNTYEDSRYDVLIWSGTIVPDQTRGDHYSGQHDHTPLPSCPLCQKRRRS